MGILENELLQTELLKGLMNESRYQTILLVGIAVLLFLILRKMLSKEA